MSAELFKVKKKCPKKSAIEINALGEERYRNKVIVIVIKPNVRSWKT